MSQPNKSILVQEKLSRPDQFLASRGQPTAQQGTSWPNKDVSAKTSPFPTMSLQEKHAAQEGSSKGRKACATSYLAHRLSRSRRYRLGIGKLEVIKGDRSSKTESNPILSCSSVSESALSRDSIGYSSIESILDLSLSRASQHSTNLAFSTISTTNKSDFSEYSSSNVNFDFVFGVNNSPKLKPMENMDRTLKELATPDVLEPAQSYDLKSGLIHLLPKFHGLAGEDPHKHLKEFHVVCSTMRPQGIPEDYIKMKKFSFSLDELHKISCICNQFSSTPRFFPASKTVTIKKNCGIRQQSGETLHKFNKLCATCPHHQINKQLLIQYFYEGMTMMNQSMIDAISGGALMDKTPVAARHLISNMVCNT
ncbi:hypothetical protein CR513_15963, partial [Mucuna pruriens]